MRIWKRSLAMLTVLILLVGSLAACGNKSKEASESNGNGPVEIELWYGLGGNLGENMKKKIAAFNESQDEVKVVGVAQGEYQETFQKLQASIASGKAPAVALLSPDMIKGLANKNILASLDEMIKNDADINVDDFVQSFYKQGEVNGQQVALPAYGTTQVLYYREDVFEKAGISPDSLKTWEGLGEVAKKLTKKNGEETVFYGWEPMYGSLNLIDASLSHGGKIFSDDGKEIAFDSKEWIDTWEFFRKAIHEDKTMRIHHGGQGWEYWYKTIDDVMQDRAAGYTGSSGDQGDLDFTKVAAVPQPGWEGHEAKPFAETLMMTIPKNTPKEQQEAAYKWMKFFTSPENTADWSINTGYISVRESATETPVYKEFAEKNPQILVPLEQAKTATPYVIDPTGGKVYDALNKAADQVEIEGISAEKALKEAKVVAQEALDQALKGQ
ncbi:ABC transporter substrate-binding protein [Bacillaceae bacterium SAOS 7]|nr:ABC transporter substrate-binding protein [Bacillaceae bacterium SAOS 7]